MNNSGKDFVAEENAKLHDKLDKLTETVIALKIELDREKEVSALV